MTKMKLKTLPVLQSYKLNNKKFDGESQREREETAMKSGGGGVVVCLRIISM